ncbi:hypothetical protein VaNZ11_002895 [Volvox africanus]|uniref:AAA+ ATPase domain-containing protein n=1 Tax=Volvox africanus TaxID=51714 RepID=A0ABQ5RSW8_9CHLO|nr:hypothetical protein VaNZ11_002895 [Volvox africanus]
MNMGHLDGASSRALSRCPLRSIQKLSQSVAAHQSGVTWPPMTRRSAWPRISSNTNVGRSRWGTRFAAAAATSSAPAESSSPTPSSSRGSQPNTQQQLPPQSFRLDEDAALLSNFHRIDASARNDPSAPGSIFSERFITDPRELHLVGAGLPIIDGPEWPDQYWRALQAMSAGRPVELPRPHPKFTQQDLGRIAASEAGPQLDDLVLEHVERLTDQPLDLQLLAAQQRAALQQQRLEAGQLLGRLQGPEDVDPEVVAAVRDATPDGVAHAFRYIPRSVLGDYRTEVEPDWRSMPQMSVVQLYNGLRQRNWTSSHYRPDAEPWRVQFFTCDYLQDGVTGWTGWRAVVTSKGGVRQWVDMPEEGELVQLEEQAPPADLMDLGYRHVFAQLYQAFEARYPPDLVAAIYSSGGRVGRELAASAAAAGGLPHETPALRHLDVSYHSTGNPVQDRLTAWLFRPSLDGLGRAIQWGLDHSGLHELRQLRDRLLPGWKPPTLRLNRSNNNLGVVYFAVCLTLGIVIPALRRSRILDIRTLEEDPGAAMEFARSKSEARKEGLTGVEFADVAGLGPILSEVVEVVEFLRDPKTFSKLGARPPKGILLEGDPGTGKTLLAKALAGEAMVPFYQMSGTEFTEGIVGLGAARVRDLFKRARATAPCVIFVDEIDALGLRRAENDSAKTNEEREQTLNQLLTEMDGFTPDTGVVFLGATNRADLLDPALMRPGRFDRKIRMPKPDTEGRYEILKLHLRNKQLAPDVDLLQLARDLPGLVGADLANIVNEAALAAVRDKGRTVITAKDMYAGVDRFTQGEVRPALPTTHRLPILCFAAKEIGIALVASVLRERHGRVEAVERVSIQPKGRAYSRTMFQRGTDEEYHVMTRGRMMDRIRVSLAGGYAVRLALGEETNFTAADIKRAYRMAKKFVFYYGFSDLGITTWANQPYSSDFLVGQQRARKVVSTDAMDGFADWPTISEDFRFDAPSPSDVTWHRYTDEVRRVIKSCSEDVLAILEENKEAMWAGIKALADRKELLGPELRDIFDQHSPRKLTEEQQPRLDMTIYTDGDNSKWPYGIEWLNDAYPVPYWVRKADEEERQRAEGAREPAAAGTGPV